ncbi:MAG: DUF3467 domain-containing protein [Chloroflexi bacterium]|nr:MAG: DUF3467 domain-containing protein [Chloroflexota bacterium]
MRVVNSDRLSISGKYCSDQSFAQLENNTTLMSEQNQAQPKTIDEILNNAEDLTNGQLIYSNAVRVHASSNDVTLDLYILGTDPRDPVNNPVQAKHLHRIVLPLGTAKEMAQIVLNVTSQWEEAFGISLPFALNNKTETNVKGDRGDN